MPVVALDVGYSNLKVAHGPRGAVPRVHVRPAGAAPAAHVDQAVRATATDLLTVDLDGRPWIAGVEPARMEGWNRPLHEDYAASEAYLALIRAGLALTGERFFDVLVTGLPVSQAGDTERVAALRQRLRGTHRLDAEGGHTVEVAEVKVVAQPVGALVDLVATAERALLDRVEEGVLLVIDAGFYSFDWALAVAGNLRRSSSGTSLEAMSVLLDRAARSLVKEYGGKPMPLLLEAAVRAGRTQWWQAGHAIDLGPVLARAAAETAPIAIEALRQALRREDLTVDVILLSGGGGVLYGEALRQAFPTAWVVTPTDAVTANVRGFFRYAR